MAESLRKLWNGVRMNVISSEEPLVDVAYRYDGTLEGLLSAVFQAYASHENPLDITRSEALQPRLGQTVRDISTDIDQALRVQRGIHRTCGQAAFDAITHASLSDKPDAGSIIYRFIRYAMAQNRPHNCTSCPRHSRCAGPHSCTMHSSGRPDTSRRHGGIDILRELTHPAVEPLLCLDRSVMNERHRMQQFLRFEHMENGVWFSQCNPNASVVPLLMDWFCGRFNTQPFVIYDENHNLAGIYEGKDWYLVKTDRVSLPEYASDEKLMQTAWKRFYDTVSIEARYNPELRRQFMPKRFWKNILEMHERIPGEEMSRTYEDVPGMR